MQHPPSLVARVVLAVVCLTLLSALPVRAQQPGGLFGSTRSDRSNGNKLNFTFEVAEGIETSPTEEQDAVTVDQVLRVGGPYTMLGGSTTYARSSKLVQLSGSASTAYKYYQTLDRLYPLSHGASVGIRSRLPKNGHFEINQAVAYSPSYLYQLFPQVDSPSLGAPIPLNPDFRIDQTNSRSYSTGVAVDYGSARGTQLSTFGNYRVSHYDEDITVRSGLDTRDGGVRASHAVSRNASFALGYRYLTSAFDRDQERSQEHEATIGGEYSLALSASRRLTIRVNARPAWLRVPVSALDAFGGQSSRYVSRLQGDANISYPFRRNWLAGVTYDRSTQYFLALSEPLLTDSARANVNGLITRRLNVGASAAYVTADSAAPGANGNLDTYTATVKIGYAVKRSLQVYSEYLYYYYDQRGQIGVVPGLPAVFEQHSVRVGLTLFVDALGR